MARTHTKMRARSASRSSRGPVGSLLYGLAAVAIVLMKSEWFRRWLTSKLGVGAAWVLMCAVTLLLLASAALIAQRHQRKLQVVRDHDIAIAGPVALYLRPSSSPSTSFLIHITRRRQTTRRSCHPSSSVASLSLTSVCVSSAVVRRHWQTHGCQYRC